MVGFYTADITGTLSTSADKNRRRYYPRWVHLLRKLRRIGENRQNAGRFQPPPECQKRTAAYCSQSAHHAKNIHVLCVAAFEHIKIQLQQRQSNSMPHRRRVQYLLAQIQRIPKSAPNRIIILPPLSTFFRPTPHHPSPSGSIFGHRTAEQNAVVNQPKMPMETARENRQWTAPAVHTISVVMSPNGLCRAARIRRDHHIDAAGHERPCFCCRWSANRG